MPSETVISDQAKAALLLLQTGVICNAAVIPYISVYIVEGLGKEPWMISINAMTPVFLTLIVNRQYGEWIDAGKPIAPMIAASILAFALAMKSILTFDIFWVLVCFASPCFAISNASVPTMYSFGRQCQRKLACAGQGGFLASNHDQTRHIQVLQDEPGDHPPGGYDVCALSTFSTKCGVSVARTQHRDQPRDGSILVEQVRPDVRRRDPKKTGSAPSRSFELAMASG